MENSSKIKIAVIGCGGRSAGVVRNLLDVDKKKIEIVSVYDPSDESTNRALNMWNIDAKDVKICNSYQEAIDCDGINWVMVFSPNAFHKEHIIYAFNAKKNVFSEKPLATTIEDCKEVYQAHKSSNLLFATGFVLRYASIYRKVKEILSSGRVGKLLSVEANENIAPAHGGYIMMNWRRQTKVSGPHILEKCCHDLDLINWFVDSLPTKVSAFGSREFFKPANKFMEDKYGKEVFATWWDPKRTVDTPFNDDNDLMDTFVGIADYRNGVHVSFNATMSNPIPERRMRFNCSEGSIILELYSGSLTYKIFGEEEVRNIQIPGGGHGDGDSFIMKELLETMTTGVAPKCSGNEGLESAVFAIAFDQAAQQNKIIDIEPIWEKLGR